MKITEQDKCDIRVSYRQAANQRKQIGILAELYATDKNVIRGILGMGPERLVKDRLPHIKRRIRTRRAPLLCGGANMQRHGWRRGHIAPAAGAAPARCTRERSGKWNNGRSCAIAV